MPFFTDPVDTIIINATLEGRNLIARMKFGTECIFQVTGWQLGRGGYTYTNPVKVDPIVDVATQSVGYILVASNTNWKAGDQIVLNGKSFIRGTDWNEGPTAAITAQNILASVLNSTDPRHYRLVIPDIDPLNPARLRFTSTVYGDVLEGRSFNFLPSAVDTTNNLINYPDHGFVPYMQFQVDTTGTLPNGVTASTNYYIADVTENTFQLSSTLNTPTVVPLLTQGTGIHSIIPTGNLFPLNNLEVPGPQSFMTTPMSLATSTFLIDAAYPVPPTFGSFSLPDGQIERPSPSSISFVMRVPDGPVGMNAYGEIGLWATMIQSTHPMEIGRKLLFAQGHFPIQAKSDRHLFTYRVIVNF